MNRSYKVAKEPGEIPAFFIEAWMKRDADFLASLFSEDAEFVNVVGLWWMRAENLSR